MSAGSLIQERLRGAADAWIGGGWHTALGAAAFAADAGVRLGRPGRETLAFTAMTAGGTLALYGGRYAVRAGLGGNGDREAALRRVPAASLSWSFGAVLAVLGALHLPPAYPLWALAWGVVSLAYCYPILARPLREYGTLKPLLLALCWTALTAGPYCGGGYFLLFAARFLWILGLTLAFDMKDVAKDQAEALFTPAGRWKPRVLWGAVTGLMTLGLMLKLWHSPQAVRTPAFIAWLVSLLMLLRLRRRKETREWIVWGDGTMIVYPLVPLGVLLLFK